MSTLQMTAQDLTELKHELAQLEGAGRAEIAERIKTAREWGDISENAEYSAAKEEQAHLETRIVKLRDQVSNAVVVVEPTSSETVSFGCTVTFLDQGRNKEQTFKLVSSHDSAPAEGRLSIVSPIATALQGHTVGDVVEVRAPKGVRSLLITAIS